ncbi:MAG TPA: tetratricopeptide repeat protein [Stellaceae bacterium]|nr:tetratricopeptide repeat protein [Stellaceae bacterium]
MSAASVQRKLAAIFAADIAGYSRLMGRDEVGTVERLKACRAVLDRLVESHRGRIFNTAGDSVVADFASAVDAVECAIAVQQALAAEDVRLADGAPVQFRIGIHVGDVIVDGANLLGDAVNVAARLEALAEPGAVCVSAAVHDQIGAKLAVAFSDLGEQSVKNIAQPVRAYRIAGPAPLAEPSDGAALALPDKPSIAVLPFANLSGDPEQDYFADGMVEEIITALSRIRWLFVIARNSSFTYKGQVIDVKRVGRELGVRYALEGSVRKAGSRVRITGQLVDAATGAHLWADRFDGSLDDVFALQDSVASSIAGVIEPTLRDAELRHAAERRGGDPTAYDLYLRALASLSTYGKERIVDALALLDEAIARHPRFAPALALAARCRVDLDNYDASDEHDANRRIAIELAREALRVGADDPGVLGPAAMVLGRFGEDIDAAVALIDRALALNPSFADGWYWSGWLRLFAGQPEPAIEHFNRSLRLNPRAQRGFHLSAIGTAQFIARRFDDAVATLRISLEELPSFPSTYRALAACYAQMGRLDEARAVVGRLRSLTPVVLRTADSFRNPEHREFFAAGLRRAAGELG